MNLKRTIQVKNLIVNQTNDEMRTMAKDMEKTTEFGSPNYISKIRNIAAKKLKELNNQFKRLENEKSRIESEKNIIKREREKLDRDKERFLQEKKDFERELRKVREIPKYKIKTKTPSNY